MSGVTATTVLAGAALAGTAYSIYSGERNAAAQKQAQEAQAKAAEEAANKANAKRPNNRADLASILSASSGLSSSMLTGPSAQTAGKSSLLGG